MDIKNIEMVSEIYDRIVESIDNVPQEVKDALKKSADKWLTGKKIARSSYMIPLCERLCSKKENCAETILVCLDAIVNALDDTMDIARPTKRGKWEREVTKMINVLYMFIELSENVPDEDVRKSFIRAALNFIVSLSQIPWIEKKYGEKIMESNTREQEIENSVLCIKERARDINLFIDIVLLFSGVSGRDAEKISTIVKNYRALEIFWKDLADIEVDIENNSKTQTVILFEKHGNSKELKDMLKNIAERIYQDIKSSKESSEAFFYIKNIARKKYEGSIKRINEL